MDYIIASEILYLKDLHDCLLDLLVKISRKSTSTVIFIGYKYRNLGEEEFIQLATEKGFKLDWISSSQIDNEFGDDHRIIKMQLFH